MLHHIAQRLIETFLINNRFFAFTNFDSRHVQAGDIKLYTKGPLSRWSLVPFSHGSKVPTATIFALRVITTKCDVSILNVLQFLKTFPDHIIFAKNLSKKAACHLQKQTNAGTKILLSSFKIKISPQKLIRQL